MNWLAPVINLVSKLVDLWRQHKRRKREKKAREYYNRLKNDPDFADAEYRRMFVVSDEDDTGKLSTTAPDPAADRRADEPRRPRGAN